MKKLKQQRIKQKKKKIKKIIFSVPSVTPLPECNSYKTDQARRCSTYRKWRNEGDRPKDYQIAHNSHNQRKSKLKAHISTQTIVIMLTSRFGKGVQRRNGELSWAQQRLGLVGCEMLRTRFDQYWFRLGIAALSADGCWKRFQSDRTNKASVTTGF